MTEKLSQNNKNFFYRNLFFLAIPMGLNSLLGSLINMIDTLMITELGEQAVVAVGSANKLFYIMNVTLYGVFSGFGVFISQYWGKKDLKRLQTVYVIAIITGIVISTIATIVALAIPGQIIGLFSNDPVVIKYGVEYLRVVSFSYVLSAILFSIEMVSRSTENVRLPLINSIIGLFTNFILNYIFIFGVSFNGFVIEAMGVEGAAIATVIARIVQLIFYLIAITYTKNKILYLKLSNFIFEPKLFKKMFTKTLPVVANECIWAVGIVFISMAYGKLGTEALASYQLFDTSVGLLTVFTWGVSNSSAIMLGKKIGEKNMDDVKLYTKLFIKTAIFFGMFTGLIIVLFTPLVNVFYHNLSLDVIRDTKALLFVFAFFMPVKLLAATFIVGILRSGGDTVFALIVEISCLWGYAVPIAFILVNFTTLSLPIIYSIICIEEVLKDIICFIRYKKGNYLHNLIH
ncbi:MAG: family efflux transporter [Haloplasmataceae bacterium]|nr:family efflux transporter [Haloplasmataceae bacterium]